MFKTKRTQFAIRKLAKGVAAVLLSLGLISAGLALATGTLGKLFKKKTNLAKTKRLT